MLSVGASERGSLAPGFSGSRLFFLGAILPRDVQALSDISGGVRRRGSAGGIVAGRAAASGAGRPAAANPRAAAPHDLTGYWVSVVTEDWRWRMTTPPKGDFISIPLSDEGRRVAVPVGSRDRRLVQGVRRGRTDAHARRASTSRGRATTC